MARRASLYIFLTALDEIKSRVSDGFLHKYKRSSIQSNNKKMGSRSALNFFSSYQMAVSNDLNNKFCVFNELNHNWLNFILLESEWIRRVETARQRRRRCLQGAFRHSSRKVYILQQQCEVDRPTTTILRLLKKGSSSLLRFNNLAGHLDEPF